MSGPLRLAFVNSTHKWGGVKTWTLDLCRWLQNRGHECLVAARPGPFADACEQAGLDIRRVEFGPDLSPVAIARFVSMFRKHGTQLAVVNVGKDLRTAGVAAHLLGLPVVMRLGLPSDLRNTRKVRWMHRWISPRYLVPSRETLAKIQRRVPIISPRRITAIRTGKVPAPQPPEPPQTPIRLITTSRLNPDKGHADLLDTLGGLSGLGLGFTLRILGTGSEEAALQARAAQPDLSGKVEFTGFVTQVREYLRLADVFVLPSYTEAMPNALLEAMAEGLAPVARRVGGVDEICPPVWAVCWPGPSPEACTLPCARFWSPTRKPCTPGKPLPGKPAAPPLVWKPRAPSWKPTSAKSCTGTWATAPGTGREPSCFPALAVGLGSAAGSYLLDLGHPGGRRRRGRVL